MDGTQLSPFDSRRTMGRSLRILSSILLGIAALAAAPAAAAVTDPGERPRGTQAEASGETTLRGTVVGPDGVPVPGAGVAIYRDDVRAVFTRTGVDGSFELTIDGDALVLRVTHPAFRTLERQFEAGDALLALDLALEWALTVEDAITVVGIRADEEIPVTKTDLSAAEIRRISWGQDVPTILEATPSVTSYSDSGSGTNYSYFSVRGIQQSRINITLDGAPLNDPAEHALFFNNFHDLTSEVEGIQIQRGVGISSVGAPSFGGSVNFASPSPAADLRADARLTLGSFDSRRASLGVQSGLLGNGFSLGGRFSWSETDGYREHSGSDHRTLFLNAGWQDERSSLRLTGFLGNERSQMAFLAVEPEVLAGNPRSNPLDEAERDDFGQDFAQLRYTRAAGDGGLWTASAYYNRADGFFLLWDDPVAQNDLLDFGIDQSFWGGMVSYATGGERLWSSFGAHYNDFAGDHTLDIGGARIYRNTGFKETANAFAKSELRLGDTLLFGDLGLRWARFSYDGDLDLGSVDWLFLDPRVGVRQRLSERLSLYASAGRAQREPARLDLLSGEDNASVLHDLEAVRPESVIDIEAGIGYRTRDLDLRANVYAMEFRDEIALTGELSEVGLPLRRNVDRSYRRGMELELLWRPAPGWTLSHDLNLSRNRIRSWTQFTDVYDAGFAYLDSVPISYRDVPPLLSPEVVGNLGVEWARDELLLGASLRHVGESHLDNTGLDRFTIPAFTRVDLRAELGLGDLLGTGAPAGDRPRLRIFVNNLFDETDHYGSGYSYQFLIRDGGAETLDGIPFYYPNADRNVMVTLEAAF